MNGAGGVTVGGKTSVGDSTISVAVGAGTRVMVVVGEAVGGSVAAAIGEGIVGVVRVVQLTNQITSPMTPSRARIPSPNP